jgi:hypothetical protein
MAAADGVAVALCARIDASGSSMQRRRERAEQALTEAGALIAMAAAEGEVAARNGNSKGGGREGVHR